jgi:Protein of unknown function (DUF2510)/Mycobacterium membrane protein
MSDPQQLRSAETPSEGHTVTDQGAIAPGWYDDGSGKQRWHDGTQWTEHLAPGSTPPPRKSRAGWWISAIILGTLAAIGSTVLITGLMKGGSPISAIGAKTTSITYAVAGDSLASMTYMTVNGSDIGQESANQAPLPWSKAITIEAGPLTYSALSLVAIGDENTTTISCSITRDGEVVSEQQSTGPFATVTCSATNR